MRGDLLARFLPAVFVCLLLGTRPADAAIFVVDDTGDGGDSNPGNGVCRAVGNVCTLRAAIQEANAFAGADTIEFNIAPGGAQTIVLTAALPIIQTPMTIDGTTQPGFVNAPPFAPIIEVNAALGGIAALDLRAGSSGSTIRGLVINRSPSNAIRILASSNNVIAGNFLGTNLAGTAAGPGNSVGVFIGSSATATNNNRIGGTAAADRNVISCNTTDGIQINAGTGGAANNLVQGNYIGVDPNGSLDLGNASQGIALFTSTGANTSNTIGGLAAGAGNVISGNGNDGILIASAGTTGTLVQGNRIGTNAAGTAAIPNTRGIELSNSASGNTIGGALGSQNLISGNTSVGIFINGSNNNTVSYALIGTNAAGNAKIQNGQHGVQIAAGSSGNLIGGVSGTGNVLSGNGLNGVDVVGGATSNNSILGNIIGLDLAGGAVLGNSAFGVAIGQGANANTVGNATGGNVISGNDQAGVRIVDNGTNNNLVQSNLIGLDITGTLARPNLAEGVILDANVGATGNRIGGAGLGNVISGNGSVGIRILNAMTGTLVVNNIIGRNAADTAAVANGSGGVRITNSNGNTIGGTGGGDGNIIAGNNGSDGVAVTGTSTGNAILRNAIFSNTGLGIDLGDDGVTANDVSDGDTGANGLQNFPVISAVTTNGASVHIAGSFHGVAAVATYRVEFFAHTSPDPTGFGEGRRFLGFANVTTDAAGYAVVGVTLAAAVTATTDYVTATATDAANNTSEFAGNVTAVGELVVTTSANTVDGTTTSVAALIANNGADGRISLREAILATNATAGADTIRFGIPLSDGGHRYYRDDSIPGSLSVVAVTALPEASIADFDPDYPASLARSWYRIAPAASLPTVTGALVIDGTTQPGYVPGGPVVEIDGAGAGAGARGLTIAAASPAATARGLIINGFSGEGITASANSTVVRGNYIGTDASGTLARGNGMNGSTAGVYLGGDGSQVGGTAVAERNVISANGADGLWIDADNIVIQGNYIGTSVTGASSLGNTLSGIVLQTTVSPTVTNVTIGGAPPGSENVVSGNGVHGVRLFGAGTQNNVIVGNLFGTNAAGTAGLPNAFDGVNLAGGASNNRIGATVAAEANRIAFNGDDGVGLDVGAGTGNSILGNEIFSNAGLGIDLEADGLSANDSGDGDSGANDLMNFPFATAALDSSGTLTAYFKLDVPAGSYRVEFFKNPSGADPSGNGEGEMFASAVNVTHPGGGSQNFNTSFAGAVGDVITATATFCTDGAACTAYGSTSEFGNAITAVPTAVELISFEAAPRDGAVDLTWRTGSELDNLGFHLYRALSEAGPYERITDAVIPGLGSSPVGASYAYTDTGLSDGTRYFYKLEDIETTGRTVFHGPVSAVPDRSTPGDARETYGDPADLSFRVLERSPREALVELVTSGFYGSPEPDGSVRLEIPGFDELGSEGAPALPVKRTWLEVEAGRRVSITNVRVLEETALPGLRPANAGTPEIVASPDGVVRAGSRRVRRAVQAEGIVPASAARLVETGFQGEVKKALLELAPLRWDGTSGRLLWARRLQVRLSFAGIEPWERVSGGSRGRRHREEESHRSRTVLARLATSKAGLYRLFLADVFDSPRAATGLASLQLGHRGEAVPFHVESSAMYFVGEGDSVYELESAPGGRAMPVLDAPPSGPPVTSYLRRGEWEENRYYQAGLLEAPSLWLWDVLISPGAKSYPFTLSATLPEEAKLEAHLQGASDFAGAPEHHVLVSINGAPLGEAIWDGKAAKTLEASLAPGVLREGENELVIENLGTRSAAYSMVFLDRFALTYRRRAIADGGLLEGRFDESGTAVVDGLSRGSLVVQTSPETAWLRRGESASFHVEAGRSYLAVSPESLLSPEVRRATTSALKSSRQKADYLLVGPREFLPAAAPLLRHRREQGLLSKAVAIEEIYDEFGYGEARPEALRAFLGYAYHHWMAPPSYVVLFGDATYDRKDFLRTGVRDRVPAWMVRTSYLWTAADPLYAAVNGEDGLPDLAIGRLPAATLDEARALVEKILAYEESMQGASGRAILVADDPDTAGDFEADSDDLAERLVGRELQKIYLRQLGPAGTRRAIVDSLDRGASLLSYTGHGGIALWASENVFESGDVASLSPQPAQPIAMTMNCLNGYFHFPYFDSLAEALVKAGKRGAIAAFSPSGLSLNSPAHFYQRALVAELTSGHHSRLGDAVAAAQTTYAESGLFPELLAIYHLFGDPALRLR